MNITNKRSGKHIMFCHLRVGAVFKDVASEHFYMKMSIVDNDKGDVLVNAVRLDNGLARKFDDKAEIIKVNAELIIT